MSEHIKNILLKCALGIFFGLTVFFATYKLTESPPMWMDEGIITQVARNIAIYGTSVIQTAPGEFVSAGPVSTGYPVTFPIAVSFKLFGIGLLQARIVMVSFILLLVFGVFILIRSLWGTTTALASLGLLVTFGPLYGHGKNVLGEIPGLFFLVSALFFLNQYVQREISRGWFFSIVTGVFFGLTIATKPIFILVLPAIGIGLYLHRNQLRRPNRNEVLSITLAFLAPILVWIGTQFHGDSLREVLLHYANPHSTSLFVSLQTNLLRFVSEAQPLYCLISFVVWTLSYIPRYRRRTVSLVETVAFMFSFLILLAYLRTIGFYRYFFLAQFFSLIFLPIALRELYGESFKRYFLISISVLFFFQGYVTMYHSWVASYYSSTKTKVLTEFMHTIPVTAKIFFYQIPEAVLLYPYTGYTQYFAVEKTIVIGANNLTTLAHGQYDIVLVGGDMWVHDSNFNSYHFDRMIDRYTLLVHN